MALSPFYEHSFDCCLTYFHYSHKMILCFSILSISFKKFYLIRWLWIIGSFDFSLVVFEFLRSKWLLFYRREDELLIEKFIRISGIKVLLVRLIRRVGILRNIDNFLFWLLLRWRSLVLEIMHWFWFIMVRKLSFLVFHSLVTKIKKEFANIFGYERLPSALSSSGIWKWVKCFTKTVGSSKVIDEIIGKSNSNQQKNYLQFNWP